MDAGTSQFLMPAAKGDTGAGAIITGDRKLASRFIYDRKGRLGGGRGEGVGAIPWRALGRGEGVWVGPWRLLGRGKDVGVIP